jgi:XTP/dITP diphosphohydrolase
VRLVLASGNPGKLREMRELLEPLDFELVPQSSLAIASVEETGATFTDNALLKAHHAAAHSGLWAIADDSGLEVDALGGKPGVRSARYAGEDASDRRNLEKLLEALRDVPDDLRTARYRCSIALVRSADDPAPLIAEGVWEGRILRTPRGSGGFGYDPLFEPAGLEVTVAELEPAVKNSMSHRGQALRSLRRQLQGWSEERGRRG